MIAETPVTYEVQEEVAVITIRRPDKLNAVNRAVREGIIESFLRFEADDGAKVAILTGEGRAFCAGADLKEMAETGKTIPGGQAIPHIGRTLEARTGRRPRARQALSRAFRGLGGGEGGGQLDARRYPRPEWIRNPANRHRRIIEKFRGINPQLPTDRIAAVAFDIERHSALELIDLLAPARARSARAA